ncbi:hypothetical protein M1432_02625 [Patescibacteria group bacterium]|nr:hypothetical protein [Patescibacteria group bacterium]
MVSVVWNLVSVGVLDVVVHLIVVADLSSAIIGNAEFVAGDGLFRTGRKNLLVFVAPSGHINTVQN